MNLGISAGEESPVRIGHLHLCKERTGGRIDRPGNIGDPALKFFTRKLLKLQIGFGAVADRRAVSLRHVDEHTQDVVARETEESLGIIRCGIRARRDEIADDLPCAG